MRQADDGSDFLDLDDAKLLRQCQVRAYRSSGPGGQHRNKVSSAVRLKHLPTGVTVHGDQSRSQHENKRLALRRLRMEVACRLRNHVDSAARDLPPAVRSCAFTARGGPAAGMRRLECGPRDARFWRVAAFLLDTMEAFQGRVAPAAEFIGISTGNFVALLESQRHLLAAAQAIRKNHGCKPLT